VIYLCSLPVATEGHVIMCNMMDLDLCVFIVSTDSRIRSCSWKMENNKPSREELDRPKPQTKQPERGIPTNIYIYKYGWRTYGYVKLIILWSTTSPPIPYLHVIESTKYILCYICSRKCIHSIGTYLFM